ncbi:sialidase-1 [Terrimicrobium sacchariphilum]|uniref:exo-alpha-sialidase n=1 Tax=Terrimicrobium sacchariphilum TaxID=690879 RepID=A0A146GFI7_TERSA|nr:sialidase family protein [Terrimicrobium sacchariphilum]GAT35226.1 sialidase-1 [Terrimicrobium sacchariphilum]
MIAKYPVCRDDAIYHAWPDMALQGDRMICVFSECPDHGDRSYTRIMVTHSEDRGRTWTTKRPVTPGLTKHGPDDPHWNCPRVTALDDGRLVVIVDKVSGAGEGNKPGGRQTNWMFFSDDGGLTWSDAVPTPIEGIVPDKVTVLRYGSQPGRWLVSAQTCRADEKGEEIWRSYAWFSDNEGLSWTGPCFIAGRSDLKLCEGSFLELPDGELVCFFRENSRMGRDAYKVFSRDGGVTWEGLVEMPIPACHRPVAGMLQSGEVLVTYRYEPGGRGRRENWAQNVFASLTDVESCKARSRAEASTRVLPLDYDRADRPDTGYTGWVQFPDGEIHVVTYIVDDAPKGQIRGYAFRESAFRISSSD